MNGFGIFCVNCVQKSHFSNCQHYTRGDNVLNVDICLIYLQKPPIFYQRLNQVVEVLIDFFCVDGIGLPQEKMMTDAVKVRNFVKPFDAFARSVHLSHRDRRLNSLTKKTLLNHIWLFQFHM